MRYVLSLLAFAALTPLFGFTQSANPSNPSAQKVQLTLTESNSPVDLGAVDIYVEFLNDTSDTCGRTLDQSGSPVPSGVTTNLTSSGAACSSDSLHFSIPVIKDNQGKLTIPYTLWVNALPSHPVLRITWSANGSKATFPGLDVRADLPGTPTKLLAGPFSLQSFPVKHISFDLQ